MTDTGNDVALTYTLSELSKNTRRVMAEIDLSGRPALITRHGRFIAAVCPLQPGEVESRVLGEMARETGLPGDAEAEAS